MERPRLGIVRGNGLIEDTKLYRYVGLSQFISWVETGQTYLTRINQWDDMWEAHLGKTRTIGDDGKRQFPLYTIYQDLFGQCWTTQKESDALWRIYSPENEGLVVETSVRRFDSLTSIKHALIGPVRYSDNIKEFALEQCPSNFMFDEVFSSALIKRRAFEHEQEVRLVTLNNNFCFDEKYERCDHIPIHCDPCHFVDGIVIHPKATEWYVDTMTRYCRRAGFRFEPIQSGLYSDFYKATGMAVRYVPVEKKGDTGSGTPEA